MYLSHHAVSAAQRGVDLRADADESAGHGAHEVVLLGLQRHDPRLDGLAREAAVLRARRVRARARKRATLLGHTAYKWSSRIALFM